MSTQVIVIDKDELKALVRDPKVKQAMLIRCAEDEHVWENCCDMFLRVYQRCKWCEEER